MELVVEGNVFFEGRVRKLALGIQEGTIVDIKKVIKGIRVKDFGDRLILPGAVDAHVHFREPGMTQKEDFLTGTTSAACGGVTTILDMPNTRPSTIFLSDLEEKVALVQPKACVDFGLFAGLVAKSRPERASLMAAGHKLYMGSTTGDLLVDDYPALPDLLTQARATGKPVAVHAEDEAVIRSIGIRPTDILSYNDARPPGCEAAAVEKFQKALGGEGGHICHISSRKALEAIGKEGQGKMTCEVTPHHLLLDAREDGSLGTLGKVNPPLRKREEREALWNAFLDGTIGVLASDHAPHLEEEKDAKFWDAPAGVPGTETMLPLMMLLVKQGRLELPRLVEAACVNPAKTYGLETGQIAVGMPAHLAVYDLHAVRPIRGKNLNSKCGWSPFEGKEAVFPKAVMLRGDPIVEDWEPVVSPGVGRFLTGKAR
jgi:dihydroorotase